MSSSNLIRLGGLVTVLAGVLIIVLTTVMFVDPIDPPNIAEESTTWSYGWLNCL
jgi:hypothetical protein